MAKTPKATRRAEQVIGRFHVEGREREMLWGLLICADRWTLKERQRLGKLIDLVRIAQRIDEMDAIMARRVKKLLTKEDAA
jgi:hypothetical protein